MSDKKTRDLIYRDDLIAAYNAAHKGPPGGAYKLICEAPTVDAVPVVHGHWIELWFDEEDRLFGELPSDYKCSVCSGIVSRKTFRSGHYCPHCGAKMDGGNE